MSNGDGEHKSLSLAEISCSELKDGKRGVAIGEEELFLEVRHKGSWQVRLQDLFTGDVLTAWTTIKNFEELRYSSRAKAVRDELKRRWSNGSQVLERIILELQEHEEDWMGEEEDSVKSEEEESSSVPKEAIEAEVQKIMAAENQLVALKKHLDNILPGEDENKQAIFTLLCGSKFKEIDTRMVQMVLLKGTEGAGKSTLMMAVSEGFKVKDVGRFTPHALDYTNLEGYEILRLKEIGVMDQETQGTATIKFLSADDKGYTVEVTVRDKDTGEPTTKQYRIPPITVISSTTRIELDPQFQRRCWIFNADESSGQTERVLKWKAWLEKQRGEAALGLRAYMDYDFSKAVLKAFVERLEPCKIVIPFPETLTETLSSNVLRVRGDYDKILTFIKLYAFLNRKRLEKWDKGEVYFVTPEVCVEALKLVSKPLASMMSNLEERTRSLIECLKEFGFSVKGSIIGKAEREKIAVKIGRSEKTVRRYLSEWEAAGYMSSDEAKSKNFTLLYDIREIEQKVSGLLDIGEMAKDLTVKMQKEAQKWLNSILDNKVPGHTYVSLSSNAAANMLPEPERTYSPPGKSLSNHEITDFKPSFTEKASEDWTTAKCPKFQGDLEALPVKLERLSANVVDRCMNPGCRYTGRMDWEATYPDGTWGLLCYDCGLQLFRKIQEVQEKGNE